MPPSILFNVSYAGVTHTVLVRFGEDPNSMRGLTDLQNDFREGRIEVDPPVFTGKGVRGMPYADGAGALSYLSEGTEGRG